MGGGFLSSDQPGLLDALRDVDAMRLWELIRIQRSPTTLSEIAALSGMAPGKVQGRLDTLATAALVRTVRARKPRNSVGYVTTGDRIVVAFDQANPEELACIREITKSWESLVDELFARFGERDADPRETFRSSYVGIDRLTPSDFTELRRRINSLCEFWNLLAGRNGSEDGKGRRARMGNHAISVRVQPLMEDALPIPEVWFRPLEVAERDTAPATAHGRERSLTARETEIARALATGMHRKQAAAHLGVSIHTVTTMCKRIYAKLGVHSQAELAAVMRPPLPPRER